MTDKSEYDQIEQLAHDLVDHFTEGNAGGPGLAIQLVAAIGDRRRTSPGQEGSNPNKPGSRPPGWRQDISELLDDIHRGVDDHWRRAGRLTPLILKTAISLLPEVTTNPKQAIEDLSEWRRLARISLGFQVPSVSLPDVVCAHVRYGPGGRYVVGCGQPTLRIAEDMTSDVWCASETCHDDDSHPDCEHQPGERSPCRRTERDLRHSIRWTREQIARMTEDVA